MATDQITLLIVALLVGAAVGAGIVFVWAKQQGKAFNEHIARLNQARQLAAEQVTQARRQIEQLQRDNNVLKLAAKHHPAPAQAEPSAAPAPAPVDPAEAARLYVESKLHPPAPEAAPDPFADTLVLRHGRS